MIELATKLLSLISVCVSLTGAIISIVSSQKSKRQAKAAKAAQDATDQLYAQFLITMSEAADSSVRINEGQLRRNRQRDMMKNIRQGIDAMENNHFTRDDICHLLIARSIEASADEINDALAVLETEHGIKELSGSGMTPQYHYHRCKPLAVSDDLR